MRIKPSTTVGRLIEEHPEAEDVMAWYGIDLEECRPSTSLSTLCRAKRLDVDDVIADLVSSLEDEEDDDWDDEDDEDDELDPDEEEMELDDDGWAGGDDGFDDELDEDDDGDLDEEGDDDDGDVEDGDGDDEVPDDFELN